MANYILSGANRFYVTAETTYGMPAAIQSSNRIPAIRLQCHQALANSHRRDKTGARTYLGGIPTATRVSRYELSMNLSSWDQATAPTFGLLIQASMGAVPSLAASLVVAATNGAQIRTQSPHGLNIGSALSTGGEIRFVASVPDPSTVNLNVPFSVAPIGSATLSTTLSYQLETRLPSLSIYDYWDPAASVSRLVTGAGVDRFRIDVAGDVHKLTFSGPAADVLDSTSSAYGLSGLTSFPPEPEVSAFDYSTVPGQLGEVWLGAPLSQVLTLTEAAVEIRNNVLTRNHEFGSSYPMALVPGPREVISSFTLFAQADTDTTNLYTAAKNRTPVSAMLQLGRQPGQIMGVYLPNMVPELPAYDDAEPYLLWEFKNDLAQGVTNDEAYIAFA